MKKYIRVTMAFPKAINADTKKLETRINKLEKRLEDYFDFTRSLIRTIHASKDFAQMHRNINKTFYGEE